MQDSEKVRNLAGLWLNLGYIQKELESIAISLHEMDSRTLSGATLDTSRLRSTGEVLSIEDLRELVLEVQTEASDRSGV